MTNLTPPEWGNDPMDYIRRLATNYGGTSVAEWAFASLGRHDEDRDPKVTDLYDIKLNALFLLNYAETDERAHSIEWMVFAEHVRVAVEEWLDAVCPEFA